jgi:DNA invertase Pin-like site-specific DNA recombinase
VRATGQRIGYVRVSTLDQDEQRQLEGQVLDRVFTDRAPGKDAQRPQLGYLIGFAREGDRGGAFDGLVGQEPG